MCFAPQRRALFRHFFDIWTSKSGPNMVCFVHFDLEMCFEPQRRALFRHRNFQEWSDIGVFCTFCLPNVLRATTACTFSTSQLPKVVRPWCVLYILTSKCASRHNGVHFFDIATSKSGPTMVCFAHFDFKMCFAPQRRALFRHLNFQKWSAPLVFCPFWLGNVLRATTACTFSCLIWPAGSAPAALASLPFRPSGATNHWKNTVNRDFRIFSRIYLFFLLIFSLLSASSLLCVSTVHIVGSLASKLPSIMVIQYDLMMIWWWFDGDLKEFSLDLWWFNGDWFPDDLDSAPPGHVVVQTSTTSCSFLPGNFADPNDRVYPTPKAIKTGVGDLFPSISGPTQWHNPPE